MLKRFYAIAFIVSLLSVVIGCSSGGISPLHPSMNLNPVGDTGTISIPAGISDYSPDGSPSAGVGTMGMFTLNINRENLSGELAPLRSNALTDVLETVDVTNFMTLAPCTDCAKLHSVSIDSDGHLVVSIGIRHPFAAGDPFKPITGRNRADLHVFNVEGYIISDGVAPEDFAGIGAKVGGFRLVNADGYSAYLDNTWDEIFSTVSTIHPYITHFDDYSAGNYNPANSTGFESVTNPPPSGNLVMAMGCPEDIKDYVLDIQTGQNIQVVYAVSCTYAVSAANKTMRFTPEYRVPQHNKKAASEVQVEIVENNLGALDNTTSAKLNIKVVDINHAVAVGTDLNEMFADSSVSGISIEIPGVTSGVVTVPVTPLSGTGHDPSDPLVFEAEIFNEAAAPMAVYNGLVKVVDSYPVGSNTSPLLNGQDGIKRVGPIENPLAGLFAISEFATYQTFSIEVIETCVVPENLVYNLTLSTIRSTTSEVTGIRLDWDSIPDLIDYHIFKKEAFDPAGTFVMIDDGVNTNNYYEDSDLIGYESYQYYVTAVYSCGEADPSNTVLVILQNAEGDNINTHTVWEIMCGTNAIPTWHVMQWGICTNLPANGAGQWNPRGWDFILNSAYCDGFWTGSFSMLCTPAIPVPTNSTTAYMEFNVMVNTMYEPYPQCGGNVGVADEVMNDHYWPSMDFREGWAYNWAHVDGFSMDWGGVKNFPNCDASNDSGYATRQGTTYHYGAYNLPELLTKPNARATIAWAASNWTTWGTMNFDDIAVVVY